MKIRTGFVSNSSSTSFIVVNKTDEVLTVGDFLRENPQLVDRWNRGYSHCTQYDVNELLEHDKTCNEEIRPGNNLMMFGDENGPGIQRIFDYILRDGGDSKRFSWRFHEYNR